MKVTIAVDSFKGSMTSMEAGLAVTEGIHRVDSDVDVHIQVDLPEDVTEKLNNIRKKEQDKLFEG